MVFLLVVNILILPRLHIFSFGCWKSRITITSAVAEYSWQFSYLRKRRLICLCETEIFRLSQGFLGIIWGSLGDVEDVGCWGAVSWLTARSYSVANLHGFAITYSQDSTVFIEIVLQHNISV